MFLPFKQKSNTDAIQVFQVLVLEQLYKMIQCNYSQSYSSGPTCEEIIYNQAFYYQLVNSPGSKWCFSINRAPILWTSDNAESFWEL